MTTNLGARTRATALAALVASAAIAYAAAGSLDTTYGAAGVASTSGQAGNPNDVAVQSDGRTLVGGNRATGQSTSSGPIVNWRIERYTAAGALDTSYGSSGAVTLFGSGANEDLTDLALDGSGRCIAVGTSNVAGKKAGSYTPAATVVRLAQTGALDTTFATGGIARLSVPGATDQRLTAVALQADGRILVGGGAWFSSRGSTYAAPWVARLLSSGAVDTSFGNSGFTIDTRISGTGGVNVSGLAVQSGGQIVVAQNASAPWTITRLLGNGAVDTAFGTITASGDRVQGVAVDSLNRIVATGNRSAGGGLLDGLVVRYSSSGAADATFGTAGRTTLRVYTSQTFETAPAFQADGSIVVGMSAATTASAPTNFDASATVRLLGTGAIDTGYGNGGIGTLLSLSGSAQVTWARGLALDASDAAMLAGRSSGGASPYVWFVARYSAN